MHKEKYVFVQLVEFLDNNKFLHLVDKYDDNKYEKHFYDIYVQVPSFYMVTTASKHDFTMMYSISYEPNAYYIFNMAYDSFKEFHIIHLIDSCYVVRAKSVY